MAIDGCRHGLFNGSCYKLNFGALIKQSNSHKRAVLDYLRKVHFKIGQSGAKSGFMVCSLPLELLLMVEFSPLKSVMA